LALLNRAATRSCSHVRISRSGDLCLYGNRCGSLRILLMLPSWMSHCGQLSTRTLEDFQLEKVSTRRRGTPYRSRWLTWAFWLKGIFVGE
jgi:hypothetical protein